ncbi:hypothetical protein Tco_0975035 [Tanacetum coccineum]|uniref:Uncharacterized protein n=1 Tax=Tanacetum coccineum TaxID=301880 RepID=A0ABQ5EDK9_9ASTR
MILNVSRCFFILVQVFPCYTLLCAHALLVSLSAQRSLDMALCYSLERILITSWHGFGDWKWRLAILPFAFGGLGVYSAGDLSDLFFDDALCAFNTSMKTNLLSNPSDIAAPKLMKKMANIYFTQVTKNAESTFSLSDRQMDLWRSQREDHTSDLLRAVFYFWFGQTLTESGASDKDYFNRALLNYEVETEVPFKFRHCWEILKGSSKRMETEIPKFATKSMEGGLKFEEIEEDLVECQENVEKWGDDVLFVQVEELIVFVLFVHEMMRELVQTEMVLDQHLVEVDLHQCGKTDKALAYVATKTDPILPL